MQHLNREHRLLIKEGLTQIDDFALEEFALINVNLQVKVSQRAEQISQHIQVIIIAVRVDQDLSTIDLDLVRIKIFQHLIHGLLQCVISIFQSMVEGLELEVADA